MAWPASCSITATATHGGVPIPGVTDTNVVVSSGIVGALAILLGQGSVIPGATGILAGSSGLSASVSPTLSFSDTIYQWSIESNMPANRSSVIESGQGLSEMLFRIGSPGEHLILHCSVSSQSMSYPITVSHELILSLPATHSVQFSTGSLIPDGILTGYLDTGHSIRVTEFVTSCEARFRLYQSAEERDSDLNREYGTLPLPQGLVVDILAVSSQDIVLSAPQPGVSEDLITPNRLYYSITNKALTTQNIQSTLHYIWES
jgi:hypothetical protein